MTRAHLDGAEQRWQALYRSDVVGIAYGQEWLILDANDRFLRIVGRRREELAGGLDFLAMTPPEHRDQDLRGMEVLQSGDGFPAVEKEYLRPDGTRVPVLIGGACVGTDPYRWVCVALDLSEHKRLEWRLLLEERRRHRVDLTAAERALVQLQHSLLPAELPELPGLSLAARYLAAKASPIGGDWYDGFVVDGALVLTVGDVAGHGMAVTQTMGELRAATRTAALLDPDPARATAVLDRFVQRLADEHMATALVARYDLERRALTWASAGHFPPLLVPHEGAPRYLDGPVAPPLGIAERAAVTGGVQPLSSGDTVLLFTDGLIERRAESIDRGLERLLEATGGLAGRKAEEVCGSVLDASMSAADPLDDVALLAMTVHDQPRGEVPG